MVNTHHQRLVRASSINHRQKIHQTDASIDAGAPLDASTVDLQGIAQQAVETNRCGRGDGYSTPRTSEQCPPDHKNQPFCCNWYKWEHVHELDSQYSNATLVIEYAPGFSQGCATTLELFVSRDGGPTGWMKVGEWPSTSVDKGTKSDGQAWAKFIYAADVAEDFKYVRIKDASKKCYVDYSKVYVINPETQAETPPEQVDSVGCDVDASPFISNRDWAGLVEYLRSLPDDCLSKVDINAVDIVPAPASVCRELNSLVGVECPHCPSTSRQVTSRQELEKVIDNIDDIPDDCLQSVLVPESLCDELPESVPGKLGGSVPSSCVEDDGPVDESVKETVEDKLDNAEEASGVPVEPVVCCPADMDCPGDAPVCGDIPGQEVVRIKKVLSEVNGVVYDASDGGLPAMVGSQNTVENTVEVENMSNHKQVIHTKTVSDVGDVDGETVEVPPKSVASVKHGPVKASQEVSEQVSVSSPAPSTSAPSTQRARLQDGAKWDLQDMMTLRSQARNTRACPDGVVHGGTCYPYWLLGAGAFVFLLLALS